MKQGNIIIDSNNDAILIDFDSSKEMYSQNDDEENTCNIGNPIFIAPEQFTSNEYTCKVDSYSIGMIIHFIITRKNYYFNYDTSTITRSKQPLKVPSAIFPIFDVIHMQFIDELLKGSASINWSFESSSKMADLRFLQWAKAS